MFDFKRERVNIFKAKLHYSYLVQNILSDNFLSVSCRKERKKEELDAKENSL